MKRALALTASLLALASVPALAQTHDRSHVRPFQHGPGHLPPDSVTHAMLHGAWTGTLESHHGMSWQLNLAFAHDSLRKALLTMHAEGSMRVGAASKFVVTGDSLRWMQPVDGKECKAVAVLTAATAKSPHSMKGTLFCDGGEITFSARKTAE
jgi:hypothetical protein